MLSNPDKPHMGSGGGGAGIFFGGGGGGRGAVLERELGLRKFKFILKAS